MADRTASFVAELLAGHEGATVVGIVEDVRQVERAAFSRARSDVAAIVGLYQQPR